MIVQAVVPSALEMEKVEILKTGLAGVPLFYGKGKEATSFILQSKGDDGKIFHTYLLKVDGTTGELKLVNRNTPVRPVIEQAGEDGPSK